jgi:kynureninase
VGNVKHTAEADRVLAGAGCGYKHLNGLPGGPGFIYTNSKLIRQLSIKSSSSSGSSSSGDNAHNGVVVTEAVHRPTPMSGWLYVSCSIVLPFIS